MNALWLILISVLLIAVALYCVWLLIQFSKKLGGLKGTPVSPELEDMEKSREELLETIRALREEIARLGKRGQATF